MGKATGISSQFRGKVGNVIGYLTKNRAGRYEQSVKSYQPVVANPQSFAQALARVPVGPVQRICSALLTVIQRGFEGVSYGDASKSEFLSYNLKNFRGPFLEKSFPYIVPGPVLLTKGQLRSIKITDFLNNRFNTNVVVDETSYEFEDIGELSEAILDTNAWVKQGEQWTLVWVMKDGDQYNYYFWSFFLDPNSVTPLGAGVRVLTTSSNKLQFIVSETGYSNAPAAAAIIRSQPYGETSFRRSTTFLTCNNDYDLYNEEDDVRRAVASYRDGEDPEDWEDDPTPEYQQIAYLCMVEITEDMVTNWATVGSITQYCLGYMTKGGTAGIFYGLDNVTSQLALLDAQGKVIVYRTNPYTIFQYNTSYLNAREYSSAYGIIDEI